MGDLHWMRNVWAVEHIDRDDLSPSRRSGARDVRAQLGEEKTRLTGLRPPLRDLGEASNLL
jgi:hypothetical protein